MLYSEHVALPSRIGIVRAVATVPTYRQHYVAFCRAAHAKCLKEHRYNLCRAYRGMIASAKRAPSFSFSGGAAQ